MAIEPAFSARRILARLKLRISRSPLVDFSPAHEYSTRRGGSANLVEL